MRVLVIVEVEGLSFIWSRSCVFTRASYVPPARGVCLCVARAVCTFATGGRRRATKRTTPAVGAATVVGTPDSLMSAKWR